MANRLQLVALYGGPSEPEAGGFLVFSFGFEDSPGRGCRASDQGVGPAVGEGPGSVCFATTSACGPGGQ